MLLLVCVWHHFDDGIISVTVCQEAVVDEYLEERNLFFKIGGKLINSYQLWLVINLLYNHALIKSIWSNFNIDNYGLYFNHLFGTFSKYINGL